MTGATAGWSQRLPAAPKDALQRGHLWSVSEGTSCHPKNQENTMTPWAGYREGLLKRRFKETKHHYHCRSLERSPLTTTSSAAGTPWTSFFSICWPFSDLNRRKPWQRATPRWMLVLAKRKGEKNHFLALEARFEVNSSKKNTQEKPTILLKILYCIYIYIYSPRPTVLSKNKSLTTQKPKKPPFGSNPKPKCEGDSKVVLKVLLGSLPWTRGPGFLMTCKGCKWLGP